MDDNGWAQSARAWIDSMGEAGDFSRAAVLDGPMLARLEGRGFRLGLDVGCGEGRFCRLVRPLRLSLVGLDPTPILLKRARLRDPKGTYVEGRAEAMPFPDGHFDVVVSYLTLIDIADSRAAIGEMARVLKPGGTLLIANLQSYATAATPPHWVRDEAGKRLFFRVDNYLEERADWAAWGDIRVRNHHRPLSAYVQALLGAGLALTHWDEPRAHSADAERAATYNRVPWHYMMEWAKPVA